MAASDAAAMTTIADLPDECLREVMLRIQIPMRIHLRVVCTKWREVIDDTWSAIKHVKCFQPTKEAHGMWGHDDIVAIATSSRNIYEGVMKRCGGLLTNIIDHRKVPGPSLLPLAVRYCRNIIDLRITVSSKADDKHVNQLLAVNQKLKVLRLIVEFKDAKACLRKIATDVLEELWIISHECKIYPPAILMSQKQIVRKANSLRNFGSCFADEELINLIGQKIKLEELAVTYHGNSLKKDVFDPFLELKNLRELAILGSPIVPKGTRQIVPLPINDDFLVALTGNLQSLETLKLNDSYITDRGFGQLLSLSKLKKLDVRYSQVSDKFLYLFSGLEELSVAGCNVRDEGVIKLLSKALVLKDFDVSATLITNQTLIAAIRETQKRDNGIRLKLHVRGTNTTPSTITESSPLLEIIAA